MTQEALIWETERKANAYLKAHFFLQRLKQHKKELTRQQLKTLRGQALAGDVEGATRGLEVILRQKG